MYLPQILQKYQARDLSTQILQIVVLKDYLKKWANTCYINIIDSGSRAKGTAISIASDVDYLISLTNDCPNTLKECYDSLYFNLSKKYQDVRKQNVSIRLKLAGLEIDITPAKKQPSYTNDHSLYVSKRDSWIQTNIQKHINDIANSGRTSEIKILKIWRELHGLDFPSVYLEYLLINTILLNKSKKISDLENNVWHVLNELAKNQNNPLFDKVEDPANTNNILSDLLSVEEKRTIVNHATKATQSKLWSEIIW